MNKAKRIAELEKRQGEIPVEELDGMDFLTVIQILCDSTGEDAVEFLDSHLYKELLRSTQSNPEKSHSIILEWITVDDQISLIDEN